LDIPVKKKLFMTATPRIFATHIKRRAEEEDRLLCSMDDENLLVIETGFSADST
jgi:predicted helicase